MCAIALYGTRNPTLVDFAVNPDCEIPEKYQGIKPGMDKFVARSFSTHLKPGIMLRGFAAPLYDSEGKISGVIESLRDITGNKNPDTILTPYNLYLCRNSLAG